MLNRELLLAAGASDPLNGVIGPVHDYHGFKLQRHCTNEATVITYKAADGKIKRMAVKDARFRSVLQFGTYNVNVPGLTNFQSSDADSSYVVSSKLIDSLSPMPESVTNDAIFTTWQASLKSDKTARENCDIWMTYKDKTDDQGIKGVPAVEWCRAQKMAGRPCDLPNLYQLICLWSCGDQLDEMDPTKDTYPDLRLGYTSTTAWPGYGRCQKYNGNITSYLFSSTERDANKVRAVTNLGQCRHHAPKLLFDGVVPILELD